MNKDSINSKVAVIGTGAAGIGTLTALLNKQGDFKITVFDIGKDIAVKDKIDSLFSI